MIDTGYVVSMARYNAWQNAQVQDAFGTLSEDALLMDRAAFFGSIFATANHLLWGDRIWLYRLGGGDAPESNHLTLTESPAEWAEERTRTDTAIKAWAASLSDEVLASEVKWRSVMSPKDFVHPYALCVTHFFNHQTHHRGQIHAMLTEAGAKAPVSDLLFMPLEGPWM